MNINTRNMPFVNFNGQEMQFVKFNGVTVYESWKNLIVSGIPPLKLTKCKGVDLVDYKLYGNSKQGKVPSEYQQVEYIETQGGQHIDTNYIPNNNTRIKVKFRTPSNLSIPERQSSSLFFTSGDSYGLALISASANGNYRVAYGAGNIYDGSNKFDTETDYIVDLNKEKFYLNGSLIHSFPVSSFKSSYPIPLFGQYYMSTGITNLAPSGTRIYQAQIWDNDILVRDLIPCYRKSDNEIGMYDLVNNTFYINNGGGTFLKGSDAPTPNAPIEIKSVGEKTKNLINFFDLNAQEYFERIGRKGYVFKDLEVGESYTLSYTLKGDSIGGLTYLYLYIYDENLERQPIVYLTTDKVLNTKYTFVAQEGYHYVICRGGENIIEQAGLNKVATFQLEKGATATEYEPYGYKIPVKVSGKNKWVNNIKTSTINGITCTRNADGSLTFNGTSIGTTKFDFSETNEVIKAGTYTMSGIGNDSNSPYNAIIIVGYGNNTTKDQRTITISKDQIVTPDNTYIRFSHGTVLNNYTIKPQLEEGTTATDYEPYVEPVITNIYLDELLRKIDTYDDYIDYKNKNIERKIEEIVLTGEENWLQIGADNFPQRYYALTIGGLNTVVSHKGLCSHLERVTISSSNDYIGLNVTNSSSYGDARILARPNLSIYPTLSTWVDFLKEQYTNGTPVKVSYVLTAPTEETIELPNIPTFKGTTILEVDTKIQPSNMEVVYKGKR